MQDRFKFKVWDHWRNCWLKNDEFRILPNGECEVKTDGSLLSSFGRQITICQCTGLKDIYGELIFENDIVERRTAYNTWGCKRLVTFGLVSPYLAFNLSINRTLYKKIGNKFDNPELLKAEV